MKIQVIDQKLKSLVKTERKITHEILLLVQTLDLTKSYRDMGYSSLFEYLTKEIGYSEGAAQRRISSARLMREVPSLEKNLQAGELNLSQVSLAQVAFRQEEKKGSQKLDSKRKEIVLNKLKNRNSFETKKILLEECPSFEIPMPREIPSRDQKIHVSLEFTANEWQQVQDLLAEISHQVPDQKLERALLYWAKSLKKKSPPLRQLIEARAQGQCEFVSKEGKRCSSKHFLEIDHIKPRALGGGDNPMNLRLLCRSHNQLFAKFHGLTG